MPYIITTTTERATARTSNGDDLERHERSGTRDVTRRAVATLDEAREAVIDAARRATGNAKARGAQWAEWAQPWIQARCTDITEAGGKVGPLPDGTVIEVAAVDWQAFGDALELAGVNVDTLDGSAIDAYNAAQEKD